MCLAVVALAFRLAIAASSTPTWAARIARGTVATAGAALLLAAALHLIAQVLP
ncbi:hypothetical protein [Streptomyces sp. NPDC101149]|uniref:hypothetical protein n=1 Tax=Streptomyces sp. NPDC101149 TaxID=3366113 RepID=UPI00380B94E2